MAQQLGVGPVTYLAWEKDQKEPFTRQLPAITAFLGYNPTHPASEALGAKLAHKRRSLGLTRFQLGRYFGWDEGTVYQYERGEWELKGVRRETVQTFLLSPDVGEALSLRLPRRTRTKIG